VFETPEHSIDEVIRRDGRYPREAFAFLQEGLGRELIRLLCYVGISAAEALYVWNSPRQMLAIRLA
jgi:hypothetical protein